VVLPDSFIIIGPNHTGFGEPYSVMSDGLWQTPFWDVEVDASLAEKILSATSFLKKDYQAHMSEHAIEVQLPFIQYFKASKFKIVPIGLYENSLKQCKKDGEAMAEVLKKNNQKTLIVATSDLTHYEPQEVAEKKDKIAIDAILEMDPEKLFDVCEKNDISMCGPGAVAMMLYAVKAMGATKAQLVKYMTSAERSKDTTAVVGYVGITVS
ncbi:MAG: AmmeMemoRadiSam system protein B, partial [Actinomycetota bacterium]